MNGTYTGVVDRIEDGETAVILIEEDGDVIEQFDVPVGQLPEPAREDGGVVSVNIEYRTKETRERRNSMQE